MEIVISWTGVVYFKKKSKYSDLVIWPKKAFHV